MKLQRLKKEEEEKEEEEEKKKKKVTWLSNYGIQQSKLRSVDW